MKIAAQILTILFCLIQVSCNAQKSKDLLSEVEDALRNGSGVSQILTSEKYLSLHPDKDFREAIKLHADTNAVNINVPSEPGKKIRVIVKVTDAAGNPLKDVLVYFYQTDAKGWYAANSPHVGGNEGDMGHARLFGYARTNNEGTLTIQTVKPSGYPQSDLPAHIHIHFERPNGREHVSELLFDDDDRLVGTVREQSIRYGFHIATPETAPAGFDQQFSYNIQLK